MRVKNCLETVGRQFLPRDINLSRRALWEAHKHKEMTSKIGSQTPPPKTLRPPPPPLKFFMCCILLNKMTPPPLLRCPCAPGHLRPVIIKPVGRIFEISDSHPIRRKCGKCGRSLSPQKNKGLKTLHGPKTRKTRKMRKMRTRKRGKCGKCG